VPACGHSQASSARTINPPSLLSGPHFGRRCRSLSSRRCKSADPPPVPARSAHAALPWMAELAARRYSPSPERWIEHPQNPSAFDPGQRDDLTGRQIGLRPAWGQPAGAQQRRLPLRYKRLAKIINLAENLDDLIQTSSPSSLNDGRLPQKAFPSQSLERAKTPCPGCVQAPKVLERAIGRAVSNRRRRGKHIVILLEDA
jgi:hypothetical protein